MKKIILLLTVLMLVGCGREFEQYTIKEPVGANAEYKLNYSVEYEDGVFGTKSIYVSKEVYDQYIKETTSEVEFE